MKDRAEDYKRLFGDVVLVDPSQAGNGQQGNQQEPSYAYVTQMPLVSPQKMVSVFKNKCFHPGPPATGGNSAQQTGPSLGTPGNCGIQEDERYKVTCGICPGIFTIMKNWEDWLEGKQIDGGECGSTRDEILLQASLGHPITGRKSSSFWL